VHAALAGKKVKYIPWRGTSPQSAPLQGCKILEGVDPDPSAARASLNGGGSNSAGGDAADPPRGNWRPRRRGVDADNNAPGEQLHLFAPPEYLDNADKDLGDKEKVPPAARPGRGTADNDSDSIGLLAALAQDDQSGMPRVGHGEGRSTNKGAASGGGAESESGRLVELVNLA